MEKNNTINGLENRGELINSILIEIEKQYSADSYLYKGYSDPKIQETLSMEDLKLLFSLFSSDSIEKDSPEKKIQDAIEDCLLGKENISLYHLLKQKEFGKGKYHKRDVVEHTQNTLLNFRLLLKGFNKKIDEYFNDRIDGIKKRDLMELAIIFHDAGKMDIYNQTGSMKGHADYTITHQLNEISYNFNLTKTQTQYIKNIIEFHDIPPESLPESEKLYLINNNVYIEYLLISVADLKSTQGPAYDPKLGDSRANFAQIEISRILNKELNSLEKLL